MASKENNEKGEVIKGLMDYNDVGVFAIEVFLDWIAGGVFRER